MPSALPLSLRRLALPLVAAAALALMLVAARRADAEDAGVLGAVEDGVPRTTVAFFTSVADACPAGWVKAGYASGRLVVGVTKGERVMRTVGSPLADQEDRPHRHSFNGTALLKNKKIIAADGGDIDGAKAMSYPVPGETAMAPSGLPFVQLVACEKQ